MKSILTPIATLSFDKATSILHIEIREGAEMNLENAQLHYEKINDLVGTKPYLALVDVSNYYLLEKEAWLYTLSNEVCSNRIAVAHYNSCMANSLTTSFFKTAFPTPIPMKLFQTKSEAIKWLMAFEIGFSKTVVVTER